MKFFVGVFILLISLLAFGAKPIAYSRVQDVATAISDKLTLRAPLNNIDPGDFVHAD